MLLTETANKAESKPRVQARDIHVAVILEARVYRESLIERLRSKTGIGTIVGYSSYAQVNKRLGDLDTDIVLVDPAARESLHFVRDLTERQNDLAAVCLSTPGTAAGIVAFTEAGIAGFAPTDCSVSTLRDAIIAAADRRFPCDRNVVLALASQVVALATAATQSRSDLPLLTRREQEIIRKMATGMQNKRIAEELFISLSTVKNHVHNILEKLRADNRIHAVTMARELGLL